MPAKRTPKPVVTVELLGKLLFEEFERDGWGNIDPFYFQPPEYGELTDDYQGLDKVLTRVVKRLNIHLEPR